MSTQPITQKRVCPRCREAIVPVPIVYGYPSTELFEAAEAGTLQLGGCLVGPESPELACPACGAALPWAVRSPRQRAWDGETARDTGA